MQEGERLVFVHGTFASDPSDEGSQWWQKGGVLQQYLLRHAAGIVDAENPVVFHWSGENSATERVAAGADLCDLLLGLEANLERYHVVAHSHGGGVVLEGLTEAILLSATLPGLVSWTTIGTPFVFARPQDHWVTRLRHPWRMIAALAFATANLGLIAMLVSLPFVKWIDWQHADLVLLPALLALLLLTTSLSGRLSMSGYLISRVHARAHAIRLFGPRWLPVWSTGDEALNSLAVTVPATPLQVIRRRPRPRTNPYAPLGSIVRWPALYLVTIVVNLLRPRLNDVVTSTLLRALQGYDYVYGSVVSIGPGPVPPFSAYPSIPPGVDREIIERADAEAEAAVAGCRAVLYSAAMMGGDVIGLAAALHEKLSGRELVHTRYFEHEEILAIVEAHIRARAGAAPSRGEVQEWLLNAAESISAALAGIPMHQELCDEGDCTVFVHGLLPY